MIKRPILFTFVDILFGCDIYLYYSSILGFFFFLCWLSNLMAFLCLLSLLCVWLTSRPLIALISHTCAPPLSPGFLPSFHVHVTRLCHTCTPNRPSTAQNVDYPTACSSEVDSGFYSHLHHNCKWKKWNLLSASPSSAITPPPSPHLLVFSHRSVPPTGAVRCRSSAHSPVCGGWQFVVWGRSRPFTRSLFLSLQLASWDARMGSVGHGVAKEKSGTNKMQSEWEETQIPVRQNQIRFICCATHDLLLS